MQGGRVLRNEAYEQYAAATKGEAQRRRWALFSGLLQFIGEAGFEAVEEQRPEEKYHEHAEKAGPECGSRERVAKKRGK